MRLEARRLAQALLVHHNAITAQHPPGKQVNEKLYLISYSDLCSAAGVPHILGIVGTFLGEVADWCSTSGWPPLNSLAVNGNTGLPGDGYDGAGGFMILDWPSQVKDCIRFKEYPSHVP